MANPMAMASIFEAAGRGLGGAAQHAGASRGAKKARGGVESAISDLDASEQQQIAEQQGLYDPYMQAGVQGTGELSDFRMRESGPYQMQEFGGVDMAQDPGAQYRMQAGVDALDTSAANKGSLFSGMHQKALMDYGQNLGSQEFQNAYGRQYGQHMDEQTMGRDIAEGQRQYQMGLDQNRMSQLQGLSGMGLQSTSQYGQAASGIRQGTAANRMALQGELADLNATITSAPFMAAGSIIGSAGSGGGDVAQAYDSRGNAQQEYQGVQGGQSTQAPSNQKMNIK